MCNNNIGAWRRFNQTMRMLAVLLLLLAGGAAQAWAEEYTYYVVRADGNQKLYMKKTADPTDGIAMPEEIQVPYIPVTGNPDGYRFFTTAAAAQAYSKDHTATRTYEITAGTTYTAAGLTNKTVYVGYYYDKSLKPSDLPELDGVSYYKIKNSKNRWLYSNNSTYGTWSDTEGSDNTFFWAFKGNDPYDIRVLNSAQPGKEGYVKPMGSSYDLEFTKNSGEGKSFFILGNTKDTNGYNLGELNLKDTGDYNNDDKGTRFIAWLMDRSNNSQNMRTNGSFNTNCGVIYRSYDNSSSLTFTFAKYIQTKSFSVINKSGAEAIRINNVNINASLDDAITIPDEIRSPYLPDDASYRLYKSTDTDKAKTFADGNITTFGESDNVILVGYDFNASSPVPDGLPKLDGKTEYFVQSKTDRYLYAKGSIGAWDATKPETNDNYVWTFSGEPYSIKIANKGIARWAYTSGCSNSTNFNLNQTTQSSGSSYLLLGNNTDGLNIGIIDTGKTVGTRQYIIYMVDLGVGSFPELNGQNAPVNEIMHNNNLRPSEITNVYTSGYDEADLVFTLANPVATYTYHIINGQGNVAATYTEEQAIGDAPSVPDAIRSPLLGDDAYYYYTAQDRNTELTELPEGGGDVWVDYNWDESPLLDLYGKTPYNLVADGTKYLIGITGDQAAAAADANMLWTLEGATLGDPYDIKIINYTNTAGSAEDRAANRRQLLKTALGAGNLQLVATAGSETVQTFYLTYYKGDASSTKYALAPVGNAVGTSEEYYVQYDGGQLKLTQTAIKAQTDNTGMWLQPQVYKFKYKYTLYGGVNGADGVVATATSHTPTVKLPRRISSPLLKKYDYEDEGTGAAIAEGAELEWKDYQLKATYDYTNDDYRNADVSIDLSGVSQYLLSDRANYRPYDLDTSTNTVTLASGNNDPKSPTDDQILGEGSNTQTLRWSLKGNDPYAIEIVNNYKGYSGYSVVADTKATGTTDYKQASATKHPLKLVADAASGSYAVKRFALVYDNDNAGNAYANDGSATPTDLHFALMVPGSDTDASANFVRSYGPQNYVEVVNIPVDDTDSYFQMNYASGGNRWGGTVFLWKAKERHNYTLHMQIQGSEWTVTYNNQYVGDPITFPTTWPTPGGTGIYHYYTDAAMTDASEVETKTYPTSDAATVDLYVKYECESWGDIKFVSAEDLATTTDWFFIIMTRTDLYNGGPHKDMPVRSKDGLMKFYGPDMMAPEYDFDDLFTNPMKVSRREGRRADMLGVTDEYLWAFVGDPYNVRLYNKATGTYLALKTINNDDVELKGLDASGYTFDWVLHSFFRQKDEDNSLSKADNTQFSLYWKNTTSGAERGLTPVNSGFTSRPETTSKNETAFHREGKSNSPMFSFKAFRYIEATYQDLTFEVIDGEGNTVASATFSKADKQYAVGDIITTDATLFDTYDASGSLYHDLPMEVKRRFCDYTLYPTTEDLGSGTNSGDQTVNNAPGGQTIYASYALNDVGLQVFMPEGTNPGTEAGKRYTFFMDDGVAKDAQSNIINYHWRVLENSTTSESNQAVNVNVPRIDWVVNRFSVETPQPLKWYFRGDPYHARVFVEKYGDSYNMAPMTSNEGYNIERYHYEVRFGTSAEAPAASNAGAGTFEWQMMETHGDNPWSFALAFRQEGTKTVVHPTDGLVTERVDGVWYYLCKRDRRSTEDRGKPGQLSYAPSATHLDYDLDNGKVEGSNGKLLHKANTTGSTLTLIRPAIVSVSAYRETDLSTPVTEGELSEYYGVGEKFQSLPDNVKRKFCDYTLIDPSTKADLANQNDWFELEKPYYEGVTKLAAKYHVHSDAPFVSSAASDEEIWTDENTTWFNMAINNDYAYFDRNYGGLDSEGNPNEHYVKRHSGLIVPSGGEDTGADFKYHKGYKWAFVGDPYEFYIINKRHRTFTFDEQNYKQTSSTVGYLAASLYDCADDVSSTAYRNILGMVADRGDDSDKSATDYLMTHYTFMMDPRNSEGNYYLSLSESRKSGEGSVSNIATTTVNSEGMFQVVSYDNYYKYGQSVKLRTMNKDLSDGEDGTTYGSPAKNEAFDCIVNVYNGENKVVATSGWTELPRNATGIELVPVELRRYGCQYTVWADATMTANEVDQYDSKAAQKDIPTWDGTGDPNEEVFLIPDGATLFVTYTYNDQLYSSENELRWVNCYFKWDFDIRETSWKMDPLMKYSWTNDGRLPGEIGQSVDRYGDKWSSGLKTQETKVNMGWMYSLDPEETPAEGYQTTTAYADQGDLFVDKNAKRTDLKTSNTAVYDGMKWALIGDPYEFQLKSFYRQEGTHTYEYLNTNGNTISHAVEEAISNGAIDDDTPVDKKFQTELTAQQKQGFTYTYKVDNAGLGYLALKDELKGTAMIQSSADTKLIGSVLSYISLTREKVTEGTEDVPAGYSYELDGTTYTKGTTYSVDNIAALKTLYDPSTVGGWSETVTTLMYDPNQYPFTNEKGEDVKRATWSYENEVGTKQNLQVVTDASVTTMNQNPELVDGIKQWYVEPMDEYAREVLFRLHVYQKDKDDAYHRAQQIYSSYADDAIAPYVSKPTIASGLYSADATEPYKLTLAEGEEYPVTLRDLSNSDYYQFVPYTIENYGVGNNLVLPWSYRRQYCDYYFKAVKVEQLDDAGNLIADVTSTVLADGVQCWYKQLDKRFKDCRVTFDVFYKTQDAFQASTSESDAWWYDLGTQETLDLDAMRMQFKYSDNIHTRNNDRAKYNTDDWLWAVEGDPYGFKMHNRYARTWDEVLTVPTIPAPVDVSETVDEQTGEATFTGTFTTITADPIGRGSYVTMQQEDGSKSGNQYFEMMVGNYGQSFLFHPLGAEIIDRYPAFFLTMFVFNSGAWPTQLNEMQDRNAKRNIAANWSLEALSAPELLPYYNRAGHVGALTTAKAEEQKVLFTALQGSGHTRGQLKQAQQLVHDLELQDGKLKKVATSNLVQLTDGQGYYRLVPWSDAYTDSHYLAGPHTKDDADAGIASALKLRQNGVSVSEVNRLTTETGVNNEKEYSMFDPASIFQFSGKTTGATYADDQLWQFNTQGIDVNTGKTLRMDPIGVGAFTLRAADGMTQQYVATDGLHIGDTTTENELAEDASGEGTTKWMIQPVGREAANAAGTTYQRPFGLKVNAGLYKGTEYHFASVLVPFDLYVEGDSAFAYTGQRGTFDEGLQRWRLQCERTPVPGTLPTGIAMTAADSGRFVPAGSPVLIRAQQKAGLETPGLRTHDASGLRYVLFNLPNATASAALTSTQNKFVGKYLEQTLAGGDAPATGEAVFVFGQATDNDFVTKTSSSVGFFVNKNTTDGSRTTDKIDNLYVRHNKLYYCDLSERSNASDAWDVNPGAPSRQTRGADDDFWGRYILVDFGDGGVSEQPADGDDALRANGDYYDLQGRKAKTDGDGRTLRPGVYIRQGKTVVVKRR